MDFILLCQLSAVPCHFHLLHILFARLQNLTLVLSPWPVDIGHWSSRKHTINLNTVTKNRLQKGKIVVIATFLNFIPKGSGLKRFPWSISQTHVVEQYHISVNLIYRWKYFLFGDLIYSDFISNLFLLLVLYQ